MAAQQQAPAHNHGLHDSVFSSALNPSGWMSVEQMCQLMMFPPQYPAAASHPGGQLHHANEQDGQGRYPTPSGDDEMQSRSPNYSYTLMEMESPTNMMTSPESLPGLALRPGNPNISFAASAVGLKRSPSSLVPGKENSHLAFQQPASTSNPYLSSNDLNVDGSYNPLCVPSHDAVGFGIFPYDDDEKPSATGFHPINSNDNFHSLHLAPRHSMPYEAGQHDDNFGI